MACVPALPALLGDAEEEGFAIAGDGVRDEPLHRRGRSGVTGGPAGEMTSCLLISLFSSSYFFFRQGGKT